MAIDATTVTPVTVNPTNVRYSLNVDKFGTVSHGLLRLQRSENRTDGTWMDDPHPGSQKSVPLPTDDTTAAAWAGIEALLPSILSKLGVTATYTGYRLQLLGGLSLTGVLDVTVVVQLLLTGGGWRCATVPSLNAFLTANTDISASVMLAWAALDAAINAANAGEKWL